jgi:hypothetical protein
VWAQEPPSPWKPWKACLLVSCPVRDPITEVASKVMPRVRRLGDPEPRWLEACLLMPRPWLASQARQEPRPELEHVVDQKPKAWASPRPLSRGYAMPRLGQVSSSEGARERTQWV